MSESYLFQKAESVLARISSPAIQQAAASSSSSSSLYDDDIALISRFYLFTTFQLAVTLTVARSTMYMADADNMSDSIRQQVIDFHWNMWIFNRSVLPFERNNIWKLLGNKQVL
ncbi:hypothetical protein RIF29_27955 [Crotalaria pallida]|uniref:Uncharacterized protein n=1 Tax=Crotalaria pallida TaxID=3830 RepID=A0AAN9I1I0_CROPI